MKPFYFILVCFAVFAVLMLNFHVATAQIPDETTILYLRSDEYETYTTTGYGIDLENTLANETVSVTNPTCEVGFRLFLLYSTGESEITGGTPVATVSRTENGSGVQSGTYSMGAVDLRVGDVALLVRLYMNVSDVWTLKALFVSPVLLSSAVEASTWTFNVTTTLSGSTATVTFGSNTAPASISGLSFEEPYVLDVGMYYFGASDFLMFFLYPYVNLIGTVPFASLMLFGFGVTVYMRFKSFPFLLLVMIILSVGGVLSLIMGAGLWGLLALAATFGLAALYWKVFR